MRTLLARVLAVTAFSSFTPAALAQGQLPSVPVGGVLGARVTLAQLGGTAIAGVPVFLRVVGNCGSFPGSPTTNVVTDSTGGFLITFIPNDMPGTCTIEGRSANVVGSVQTTIYRPDDLSIGPIPNQGYVIALAASTRTHSMRFGVSAGGYAVYGLEVTIDPPVAIAGAGPPPVLTPVFSTTTPAGQVVFNATLSGNPGVWDYTVRAASSRRTIRIQQLAAAPAVTPARSLVAADDLSDVHGPTVVSIVDAPASCLLRQVTRTHTTTPPPVGMTDFPFGVLSLRVTGCPAGATVRLRAEYAAPLPSDGAVYSTAFALTAWAPVSLATVSGNAMTFSIVEGGPVDPASGTDLVVTAIGVTRRGSFVAQAKPAVHDMWWAGAAENGWGLSMAQSADGNVFAAIYAYDDAGKPTWWVIPSVIWDYARGSFEERVYSTLGTPWSAYSFRYVIVNKSGSARFTLAGTDSATLDFGIDGVTGRKRLERQAFGPPDSRTVPNVNGMWWGGEFQNGWGVSIVQQNATLFMVWFTYDETMRPTWFVMPGGEWSGTGTYEGRIYRTHGSPWLGRSYDASRLTVTDVGSYRLTFSGTSATMAYTVDGGAGSLALVRQAPF